jgi:translation initiation factor 3 subunit A
VTGEGSKERSERIVDREIVIPWLRFLWDTYRTVLDTLRNIQKLELLYKSTAEQAFQFCLTHKRAQEFRRLNDLLKYHMTSLKTNAVVQLDNPESFQIQLEIRLMQLNTAAAMELWQEAFKTVEEINGMVAPPKRTPPIEMMIVYYEKLAKIFWVSENYIFHAHALAKYHQLLTELRGTNADSTEHSKVPLPEVNESELASQVLLAALSMPVQTGVSQHRQVQLRSLRQHVPLAIMNQLEKQQALNVEVASDHLQSESESNQAERLAKASTIYGFSDLEIDRDLVLRDLVGRDINGSVVSGLSDLLDLLETKFQPLKLGAEIKSKLAVIESIPSLKQYTKTITNLAFLRIIQQLGSVYQTLRLQRLYELIPFLAKEQIEKLTIKAIREHYIEAKIDHKHGLIIFQTSLSGAMQAAASITGGVGSAVSSGSVVVAASVASAAPGTSSSFESQRIRHQLANVARNLSLAVDVILAPGKEARQQQKKAAFAAIGAEIEMERRQILKRREIIEKTNLEREKRAALVAKERAEQERLAKEKAIAEEKERQKAKAAAAEQKRADAKAAEAEAQKKTAVKQKLVEVGSKLGVNLDSAATRQLEKGTLATEDFIDAQVKVLVANQQRAEAKLRELVDRADHLARAKREAELPLMKASLTTRLQTEATQMQALREKRAEEHKKQYDKISADKARLAKCQEARKQLEARVFEARKAAWIQQENARRAREESAAAKRKQEERERQEEAARKAEAERQRQEEVARLKRERDEAATQQAAQQSKQQQQQETATGEKKEGEKLNWAQRRALEAGGQISRGGGSSGGGSSSGGAYRPPGARSNAPSGGSYADDGSSSSSRADDGGSWKRQGGSSGTGGGSGSGSTSGSTSGSASGSSGAYRPPGRRGGDRW